MKDKVCAEIRDIMKTYREQAASARGVGTPGGLEHMGDVWRLLDRWEAMLASEPVNAPVVDAAEQVTRLRAALARTANNLLWEQKQDLVNEGFDLARLLGYEGNLDEGLAKAWLRDYRAALAPPEGGA